MRTRHNRRQFLSTGALAGIGFWASGRAPAAVDKTANGLIRFACVGVGGMGNSNMNRAAQQGDVVALCDVDDQKLGQAAGRHPRARKFRDFRKMFDAMRDGIDAVIISTPDHSHAVIAAAAMRLRKHCFVEKPLARTLFEARQLGSLTLGLKVATQMNNQGTAQPGFRRALAVLKTGVLGTVKEVHVWSNRPIWPVGLKRPARAPVPQHLDWDLWLGPAPERPYAAGYTPFGWRGWWDFGTGALGDMGCHLLNLPFLAFDLRDPTTVTAQTSGHNKDSFPKWSIVRYQFPARGGRAAVALTWYDGGKRPAVALFRGEKVSPTGCLIVGDKGTMVSPSDYAATFKLIGVGEPQVEIVRSPGHFEEFVQAMRGESKAMSNILDYAGPLTETVLLGNLAVYAGKKIEWDAGKLQATNVPEVAPLIRPAYRKGYSL